MKQRLLLLAAVIALTVPFLAESKGKKEDVLVDKTSFAIGLEPDQFTISDIKRSGSPFSGGVRTDYRVATKDGRKYRCYIVSMLGSSDAMCSEFSAHGGVSKTNHQTKSTDSRKQETVESKEGNHKKADKKADKKAAKEAARSNKAQGLLVDRTSFAIGLEPDQFTISDIKKSGSPFSGGVKTDYRVATKDGRKYRCYIVSLMGSSDAMCSEFGGKGGSSPKGGQLCNELLRAAGRCR